MLIPASCSFWSLAPPFGCLVLSSKASFLLQFERNLFAIKQPSELAFYQEKVQGPTACFSFVLSLLLYIQSGIYFYLIYNYIKMFTFYTSSYISSNKQNYTQWSLYNEPLSTLRLLPLSFLGALLFNRECFKEHL